MKQQQHNNHLISTKKFRLHHLIAIISTFSSLLVHVYAANNNNNNDYSVMAKLAKSINPSPPGWYGLNPCKWTGISCNSLGRVTSITLISKFLSGELPPELTQLSDLKSLSLQRNKLTGAIPPLANSPSLEEIYLDSNNFKSIPPSFLSGLTNLQSFAISDNRNLEPWTIPTSLAESSSLVTFFAEKSNIVGTIPDIFESFPNLRDLRLSYNNLTGTLPQSFAKSGIQNLWINNQVIGLSGRIDVIGRMTQLTQAWLHVNKFSGPIPDLSKCTSLFDLQTRDNQLTGVIPNSLTSLPKLANVSLQNNKFQGPIPVFQKGVFSSLGFTNSFCLPNPGPCAQEVTALLSVSEALGYPMALADSWAGNNPCDDWNYISCDSNGKISVINLGKENWSGTISPAIAGLSSLKTLLLNDNSLTGTIPSNLTSLKTLQLVDISNNNISGKVPLFPSYVKVKTSGNPFIGKDFPFNPNFPVDNNSPNGSGTNNTPASGTNSNKKSISLWLIVGIIIIVLIFIAVLWFIIYRRRVTKQDEQNKLEKMFSNTKKSGSAGEQNKLENMFSNSKKPGSKDFGGKGNAGISFNQSSGGNSDILVYDNPNVSISMDVLREVTNNFSKDNILGRGGFGVVYKGRLNDGTIIAVKRMESSAISTKGQSEFKAEIEVLTKVRHRHLVALLGFCVNGSERLLVYEYMPYGTLSQHLFSSEKMGFSPLSWKQRVTIALDVARGVEYLHSLAQQSFIHRDLKSSNILLGDNMRAKVSDFGLVKNAPDTKHSVETRLAGTFGYLAPEYAATGRVTTKVDVFAFGVVLMEIITGRKALNESLPEEESHLVTWYRRILGNKDKIINTIDPKLNPDNETIESICKVTELAGHCTAREPYQRPDMGHAVNVLSPLVELWKPTHQDDETDDSNVGYHMNLPQALKKWQNSEGTTAMMTGDFSQTPTSTTRKPSGFPDTFNSRDAR